MGLNTEYLSCVSVDHSRKLSLLWHRFLLYHASQDFTIFGMSLKSTRGMFGVQLLDHEKKATQKRTSEEK